MTWGYLAHAHFVFGARPAAGSVLAYLVTYGAMYVVALEVIYVAVDGFGIPKPLGMLVVLSITVPLSFVLLRWGFGRGKR